jgi:hypothetical protein
MNLKEELERLTPSVEQSPWPNHEHVRGYGVFGLPLTSGHFLALRVFPINDFAPYITVWHRDPDESWSIYYRAPRPDIACPRYYGAAARHIKPADIALTWDGPAELTIQVDQPRLEWTVWMQETVGLRLINSISKGLPFWTWQKAWLLKPREWMSRLLGMGNMKLSGVMPSGHFGILMPQRIYFINRTKVQLDGVDLGDPVKVSPNPTIGDVPLPARGIFAIGQAHWDILDEEEYHRTRREMEVSEPLSLK